MVDNIEFSEDPMMAAMQKSQLNDDTAVAQETKTDTAEAKTETPEAKAEHQEVKVEAPEKKVEAQATKVETTEKKVETPEVKVKSFEEDFAERFGGKKFEEVKALIENPVKFEFADERLEHWNELAKKGIKIDAEFIELQSKDYEGITNPLEAIVESMRLGEFKGMSQNAINLELNKKYNFSEWKDKADEDMTPDDLAYKELLERDGTLKKDWLINYKNERVLEKQVDPKEAQALAEAEKQHQLNWEKFVDSELVNKVTKAIIPVGEKGESSFEFEYPEQDRKEIGEMMKAIVKDPMVFFEQFVEKDASGKKVRNHAALVEMALFYKNRQKLVALAHADGIAKEALRSEKESKNTNFSPAQTAGQEKVYKTPQEALAAAMQEKKVL